MVGITIVAAAAAACGPSEAGTANSGNNTGASGTKGATLKLTGAWTYDGPLTGHFVCFHSSNGHFELEGQQPYLVDIEIEGLADGTFTVPDYLKLMTGQITVPAGQPKIKISRLEKVGDSSAASFITQSGTITIENGGTKGVATWSGTNNRDSGQTVNAELRWHDCESAS
jgi:hypothetical protein